MKNLLLQWLITSGEEPTSVRQQMCDSLQTVCDLELTSDVELYSRTHVTQSMVLERLLPRSFAAVKSLASVRVTGPRMSVASCH